MNTIFIFGAGASYGCHNTIEGPPLTARLFDHPVFLEGLTKGKPLVSLLKDAQQSEGTSFDLEKKLASLLMMANTPDKAEKIRQGLTDLRFALQETMSVATQAHYSKKSPGDYSFYERLWNRVNYQLDEHNTAFFINMNYDTIFDKVIEDSENINLNNFDAYVRHYKWGLVHPHGSIAWSYRFDVNPPEIFDRQMIVNKGDFVEKQVSEYRIEESLLHHLDNLHPDFATNPEPTNFVDIPAIALPVDGKIEGQQYIAPRQHITRIEGFSTTSHNVVIIGWRGMDKHIIDLISKQRFKIVQVVGTSIESANDIIQTLKSSGLTANHYQPIGGGFENYIISEEFNSLYPRP